MGLMNVVRHMNTSPQVLNIHRFFEITLLVGCSQREKRQGIKARHLDDVFQLEGIKFFKRNIIKKEVSLRCGLSALIFAQFNIVIKL